MFGTRYHTTTYPYASDSVNRRANDTIFVTSMFYGFTSCTCLAWRKPVVEYLTENTVRQIGMAGKDDEQNAGGSSTFQTRQRG
ncbi:hypothetical protein TNCV_4473401 [Trichonephila clavipes]|uniref:Uncharacterized protein n=1 Tax=Trichonephila clavipes TaxID=2585209 RepID=A0A8X6SCE6_TRICX|nr:hypothetical protein TNCV_4473401 [Trichonephila clavipes]